MANGRTVDVHRDIAAIDVASDGGRVCMSVVRAKARSLPLWIEVMENHPLGSQAIAPLGNAWMLIVVAPVGPLEPNVAVGCVGSGG